MIASQRLIMEEETSFSPARHHFIVLCSTLLRVAVGIIMTVHGLEKLHGFQAWQEQVAQLGMPNAHVLASLAVAAELGGGFCLLIGLFTPLAALAVVIVLAVGIAKVHFSHGLMAQQGGFEYPLTLLCAALQFVARGAGPVSVDGFFGQMWDRYRMKVHLTPEDLGPHFTSR
jgi:putative oxidoreductase